MSIPDCYGAAQNAGAMEERTHRVANLRALVTKAGSIAAFARQHEKIDPTYVSQLINGHRSFGERAARNMESKIGLSSGTLDLPPDSSPLPTGWPFSSIPPAEWAKLTDAQRKGIEEWVAAQVAAYLGTSSSKRSASDEEAA